MRSKAICIALFILASGPSGGCAAMAMRPPSTTDPSVPPRCSEGRGGVVLDGLMATITGLGGLSATSNDAAEVGVPLLLWSSLHMISAVAGNRSANRCIKAYEAHQEWLAQQIRLNPSSELARRLAEADAAIGAGQEARPCRSDATCDPELVCNASTRTCERLPEAQQDSDEPPGDEPMDAYPDPTRAADSPAAAAPTQPTPPVPTSTDDARTITTTPVRTPAAQPAAPEAAASAQPVATEAAAPSHSAAPAAATPVRPAAPTASTAPAPAVPPAPPVKLRPRPQEPLRSLPGLILGQGEWADFWREVKR